jgi:transposase InsO family protein
VLRLRRSQATRHLVAEVKFAAGSHKGWPEAAVSVTRLGGWSEETPPEAILITRFLSRLVGWSIDSSQTGLLVTNALGMAIRRRSPGSDSIIHSDRGVQFASWVFSQQARDAGLAASMGSFGAPFDNAMVEAFWARMQVELLSRKLMEDPGRARDRDARLHRDLAQHTQTPQRPEHAHPNRIREPTPTPTTTDRRLTLTSHRRRNRVRPPTPRKPGQIKASKIPGAVQSGERGHLCGQEGCRSSKA